MKDDILFFDSIAEKWDSMEVKSLPSKVHYILEKSGVGEGDRVLDLGCGTGVLEAALVKMVGDKGSVTGVDFSGGMLEIAERKCRELRPCPVFLCKDFEEEHLEGKYDHIFLYSVYPHLEQPENTLSRLVRENLYEGGDLIIAFPCDEGFINTIHGERPIESECLPSASVLASRLASAGFHAECLEDTSEAYIVRIRR